MFVEMSCMCPTRWGMPKPMTVLETVMSQPLGKLLEGVHADVFEKAPSTVGLRELQRDMSAVLSTLQKNREYRVLTNRGAPAFLLIPLDPTAWASLLAVPPRDIDYQIDDAHKREGDGTILPDTRTVVASVRGHSPK